MTLRRESFRITLLLFPGLGLICFFIGTVTVMAISQSLGLFNYSGESELTLNFWTALMAKRQFWRSFSYSCKIALISAILSVLAAYPIALWLRTPFRGSTAISAIMKIPLLVHGLIAAFLYVNLIAYHGFINEILVLAKIIDEPLRLQNDPYGIGVIILQVWKQMPFALLVLSGSVNAIGNDILHAAQDLGAGVLQRFLKVIAPLTLKSLQAALIIIFIGAAGDFSFQVIAGPVHVNSMAQYMVKMQNQTGDWNSAAVIAVMLMILSLIGSILLALIVQVLIKRGMKR